MAEFHRRLPVPLLVAGLIALAVVSMVVDRRAVLRGGRELPAWAGAIMDVAAPVQNAVAMPFEAIRDAWNRYVALIEAEHENELLQAELVRLLEENLQLREALVASGTRSPCCPRSSWGWTRRPGSGRCWSIGAANAASGPVCR
jgi:hypothetical protein